MQAKLFNHPEANQGPLRCVVEAADPLLNEEYRLRNKAQSGLSGLQKHLRDSNCS